MADSNLLPHAVDVLVVGAGIVGLAHAAEAAERGLSVLVIDRDDRAVGASVRNFGHCCITAQSGDLLDLALVARDRWLHFSQLAGFFSIESGALAVARSATELAVLEELSASRPAGQVRLQTADQTSAQLSQQADRSIVGGAMLRDDLRVDPREAVASLASWLASQPGVDFAWKTSYLGADGTAALTSRGAIQAARTIVCVGHDCDYLFPELAAANEITRCSLQMMRVAPPVGFQLRPAVLTGTSMLRYPAFAETKAATALAAEIRTTDPTLIEIGANVMFTQRPDGSLIVGDSHGYDTTLDPFLSETTSEVLLDRVRAVLGGMPVTLIERWQGIYASSAVQPYLVAEPTPGVTVVAVTSGVGMTIAFGLASRVAAELFG